MEGGSCVQMNVWWKLCSRTIKECPKEMNSLTLMTSAAMEKTAPLKDLLMTILREEDLEEVEVSQKVRRKKMAMEVGMSSLGTVLEEENQVNDQRLRLQRPLLQPWCLKAFLTKGGYAKQAEIKHMILLLVWLK